MRWVLAAVLAVAVAGGAEAQQPQRRVSAPPLPVPLWDEPTHSLGVGLTRAVERLHHRVEILDKGCVEGTRVLCDMELRGIPIRARTNPPGHQVTEVEMRLPSRISRMNALAALDTLVIWAEPGADLAARQGVLDTLFGEQSRNVTQVGRTELRKQETFSGWIVTARPLP